MTEVQIYYLNKSPAHRKLLDMPGGVANIPAKMAYAVQLAQAGEKIDLQVDVFGYGADLWNYLRVNNYGFTWVPSLLQEGVIVSPGLVLNGFKSYDPDNPPSGSIMVYSPITEEHYPPFDKPAPAPVDPTEKSPVGRMIFGETYAEASGVPQPESGTIYDHDPRGGRFQLFVTMTPFGPSGYWKKIS